MTKVLFPLAATLLVVACFSSKPPQADVRSVGVADSSQPNQRIAGYVRSAPVTGTEVHFSLGSPATVFVIATVTFSIGAGKGYTYPNLEVGGKDGGTYAIGHHLATVDSDSGDSGPSTSATCIRVESLSAGPHTARLTMDVDGAAAAWEFRGIVRVLRLTGAEGGGRPPAEGYAYSSAALLVLALVAVVVLLMPNVVAIAVGAGLIALGILLLPLGLVGHGRRGHRFMGGLALGGVLGWLISWRRPP